MVTGVKLLAGVVLLTNVTTPRQAKEAKMNRAMMPTLFCSVLNVTAHRRNLNDHHKL